MGLHTTEKQNNPTSKPQEWFEAAVSKMNAQYFVPPRRILVLVFPWAEPEIRQSNSQKAPPPATSTEITVAPSQTTATATTDSNVALTIAAAMSSAAASIGQNAASVTFAPSLSFGPTYIGTQHNESAGTANNNDNGKTSANGEDGRGVQGIAKELEQNIIRRMEAIAAKLTGSIHDQSTDLKETLPKSVARSVATDTSLADSVAESVRKKWASVPRGDDVGGTRLDELFAFETPSKPRDDNGAASTQGSPMEKAFAREWVQSEMPAEQWFESLPADKKKELGKVFLANYIQSKSVSGNCLVDGMKGSAEDLMETVEQVLNGDIPVPPVAEAGLAKCGRGSELIEYLKDCISLDDKCYTFLSFCDVAGMDHETDDEVSAQVFISQRCPMNFYQTLEVAYGDGETAVFEFHSTLPEDAQKSIEQVVQCLLRTDDDGWELRSLAISTWGTDGVTRDLVLSTEFLAEIKVHSPGNNFILEFQRARLSKAQMECLSRMDNLVIRLTDCSFSDFDASLFYPGTPLKIGFQYTFPSRAVLKSGIKDGSIKALFIKDPRTQPADASEWIDLAMTASAYNVDMRVATDDKDVRSGIKFPAGIWVDSQSDFDILIGLGNDKPPAVAGNQGAADKPADDQDAATAGGTEIAKIGGVRCLQLPSDNFSYVLGEEVFRFEAKKTVNGKACKTCVGYCAKGVTNKCKHHKLSSPN